MRAVITLATDFGLRDPYVGIVKGVIAGIAPDARVIDITHDIPPQDVPAAAFAISSAYRFFPIGTIHVAVVDPGVGTSRRAVAMELGGYRFVFPDNGIMSRVLENHAPTRTIELTNPKFHRLPTSATFHARDIFGPVAAHLANGVALDAFGPAISDLVKIESQKRADEQRVSGTIIASDRFGNLITDITGEDIAGTVTEIIAGGRHIAGPFKTYADAHTGEALALFSSAGSLEIAVRDGSAEKALGLSRGDEIVVSLASKPNVDVPSSTRRIAVLIKECPTCGCTIPPFADKCPRCAGLQDAPQVTAQVDASLLAGKTPEVTPDSVGPEDSKRAAERERRGRDADAARQSFLAFSGAGLPIIRSHELPTSVVLGRGENCYLCTRAGHWTETPDGERKAGDYGQFLITDRRILFKSAKGAIHEHAIERLQQVNYDLDCISVKRDETRPRDIYKMDQPVDAMVKLLCVYKMANLTPPVDVDKLKALTEPAGDS